MFERLILGGDPFDWPLAKRHGMHPAELKHLVLRRQVRQLLRGVYVDARVADDLTVRARCLGLRLPEGAAVSRLTAAWLYGIDGSMPEQREAPLLECTVPPGREPLSRPGVICYVAPLDGDVQLVDGLPCTTPVRTAVDVLRWLRPHMGLAVTDALAARGLVTPEEVVAGVEQARGRRHIRQARYLAALVEPLTESPGESWLRLRIADAGFPRPQAQVVVSPECCGFRLDLAWRSRKVGIEYDGDEFHGSPPARRMDERRREHLLVRHEWTAIGVGKGEVLGSSTRLERGIGELLSMTPKTLRRLW